MEEYGRSLKLMDFLGVTTWDYECWTGLSLSNNCSTKWQVFLNLTEGTAIQKEVSNFSRYITIMLYNYKHNCTIIGSFCIVFSPPPSRCDNEDARKLEAITKVREER